MSILYLNIDLKKKKIEGVKYIYCDVSDKKLERKIDTHYDYIVNLSGYVDHSDKSEIILSHYNGCKNLSSLFAKSKIKKYIQIGSSIEYVK